MNLPSIYQTGTNQPPIANVGKTGFYIRKAGTRTLYRFPASHTMPDGTVVEGLPLQHINTPALRRAYRSVYAPHVGEKQRAKAQRRAA